MIDQETVATRFAGTIRLYGRQGFAQLQRARVCVVGVGGVGSWAVEALARSAVGHITLIDGDNVAQSNVNRQLPAKGDTIGLSKVAVLAQRIAQINDTCDVVTHQIFLHAEELDRFIGNGQFDFVIDAIDSVQDKAALINYCYQKGIALITAGSAGGQKDPTRIAVCDLTRTQQEPLLAKVRKLLRRQYGFSRSPKTKFGIAAVYSEEPVHYPEDLSVQAQTSNVGLNPAGFGTSMAVTASFGVVAASYVINQIAAVKEQENASCEDEPA